MQNLPEIIEQNKEFFGEKLLENCKNDAALLEKAIRMAEKIQVAPKTYEQDGMGDKAIAHLHYQLKHSNYKECHWYITEKDMNDQQLQAFGLVSIGSNEMELGYINILEITGLSVVELDLDFEPTTIGEIRKSLKK